MRLLSSLTLGAVIAGWVVVTGATAPQPQPEPQPTQVRVMPRGGVDVGDGSFTCWVEKAADPSTAEGICGPRQLRPAGALELGQEVTVGGHQWVATVTGLEPVGAN